MEKSIYYWYHHMMPEEDRNEITLTLTNKDYESFIELYKKYTILGIENGSYNEDEQTWEPIVFLPKEIRVYAEEESNEDIFSFISILNKENFQNITYFENECG